MARPTGPRTIVITGASSGLGAAIARALAPAGDRLALVARRAERLAAVAEEVVALGGEAIAVPADLAEPEAPARVVAAVVDRFGGLDALVNNAGIGLPRYFSESDPAALRDQVAVNFAAPIVLTRLALPWLFASRGAVINISSGITLFANPILGVYGATKAGLSYWSDALRREVLHRGVRVSLVRLGPVATEFFDAARDRGGAADSPRPLGIEPNPGGLYNAMRDRPPRLLTIRVEEAGRRVAGLLDRPRRRLDLPGRVVRPLGLLGGLFGVAPRLGDFTVSQLIRWVERDEARARRRPPGGAAKGPGALFDAEQAPDPFSAL